MMRKLLLGLIFCLAMAGAALATTVEQTGYVRYDCDGSTTGFSFKFAVNSSSDVRVLLVNTTPDPETYTVLTISKQYAVNVPNGKYPAASGTVTTVDTYTSTYDLIITTDIQLTQSLVLDATWRPAKVETALDKLTLVDNQFARQMARAPHNPDTLGTTPTTELSGSGGYGYLYRDATGNFSLTTVTSEFIPTVFWAARLIADANYTDALTGLGLTSFWQTRMTTDANAASARVGLGSQKQHMYDVTEPPYNADKTGNTDATTIIQAAIDAAATAGGGVVYLPTGTYLITAALDLDDANGVSVIGDGMGASVLLGDADHVGGRYHGISLGGTTSEITENVTLRGFTIRGHKASEPWERRECNDISTGIMARGVKHLRIENVAIENVYQQGIQVEATTLGDSNDIVITGCRITHAGYHGIGVTGRSAAPDLWSRYVHIDNCTIDYCGHFDPDDGKLHGMMIDMSSLNDESTVSNCVGAYCNYGIKGSGYRTLFSNIEILNIANYGIIAYGDENQYNNCRVTWRTTNGDPNTTNYACDISGSHTILNGINLDGALESARIRGFNGLINNLKIQQSSSATAASPVLWFDSDTQSTGTVASNVSIYALYATGNIVEMNDASITLTNSMLYGATANCGVHVGPDGRDCLISGIHCEGIVGDYVIETDAASSGVYRPGQPNLSTSINGAWATEDTLIHQLAHGTFTGSADIIIGSDVNAPDFWWKFNDDAASTTVLAAAGGVNMTAQQNTNLLSGVGAVGDALSFNGTSDYVEKNAATITGSAGTVSVWIRPDVKEFAYIWRSQDTSNNENYIGLAMRADGSVSFVQNEAGTATQLTANTKVGIAQWSHVVVESNGSAITIYVNGVEQTLTIAEGVNNGDWFTESPSRDNFTVGARHRGSGVDFHFDGRVDDVRVWTYALSATQIEGLFAQKRETDTKNVTINGDLVVTGASPAGVTVADTNSINLTLAASQITGDVNETWLASKAPTITLDPNMLAIFSYVAGVFDVNLADPNTGRADALSTAKQIDDYASSTYQPLSTMLTKFADFIDPNMDAAIYWDNATKTVKSAEIIEANDTAFGSAWNGDPNVPTKNAIFDYLDLFDTDNDGSFADEAWLTAYAVAAGTYIDVSGQTVTFDPTELGTVTWGPGTDASFIWTFGVSGTDTAITFGNNTINVSTGALQVGGTAVLTAEVDGSTTNELPTAGTAIDVTGQQVDWDSTEVEATTWGAGGNASNIWTFNVSGTDHTMTIGSALMTFSGAVTSGGTITSSGTFDVTGATGMVLGSADVTGLTITTDGTGNGELTLPNDSIGDADIDWGTGAGQVSPADAANEDIGDITITGGAWAVEDDSHAHTTTTVSGLDISDDTNLGTAMASIDLLKASGDGIDANTASTITDGDTKHLADINTTYDFVAAIWGDAMSAVNVGSSVSAYTPDGWWKCNDNAANTTVTDDSGNGYNLTSVSNTNTMTVTGMVGAALEFDGATEYAKKAVATYTDTAGSICAWVKAVNFTGSPAIFSSADEATSTSYWRLIISETTGKLTYDARDAAGTADTASGDTVLRTGEWYNVVCTSNDTAVTLYVNGVAQTLTWSSGSNHGWWLGDITLRDNICIAAQIDATPGNYLNGCLDGVRYYSETLTAAQVEYMYRFPGETHTGTADFTYSTVALPARPTGNEQYLRGMILDPYNAYSVDPIYVLDLATDAAITITSIKLTCDDDPDTELDVDLKWADARIGLANAALIHACDTTNGAFSSGAETLAVASGKVVYLQLAAQPESGMKSIAFKITYKY